MQDTTNPRDALRTAISARGTAATTEANAARAAVRAKQMLEDAERELSTRAGVDEEIAAHRADEIRGWAANGGKRPSDALPPHLAAKKESKINAEAKVSAARSTHELLNKELVAASGRHQDEQENVRRAAAAVMTAEAASLVEGLWRAKEAVWALTDKLTALGYVRINPKQPIALPQGTIEALGAQPPMLASNVPKPVTIQRERFEKYLAALCDNPEASLD
jgi:hypothetical protein